MLDIVLSEYITKVLAIRISRCPRLIENNLCICLDNQSGQAKQRYRGKP